MYYVFTEAGLTFGAILSLILCYPSFRFLDADIRRTCHHAWLSLNHLSLKTYCIHYSSHQTYRISKKCFWSFLLITLQWMRDLLLLTFYCTGECSVLEWQKELAVVHLWWVERTAENVDKKIDLEKSWADLGAMLETV